MQRLASDGSWTGNEQLGDDEVVLAATRDELLTLSGAIRETLEAVEEWEFHTRLGVTREEARALGNQIREVLRNASRSE